MPTFKVPITGSMPTDLDLNDVTKYLLNKGYTIVDGISRVDGPDGSSYIISTNQDPSSDLTTWMPTSPTVLRAQVISAYRAAALQVRSLSSLSSPTLVVSAIQAYERATTNVLKLIDSDVANAL